MKTMEPTPRHRRRHALAHAAAAPFTRQNNIAAWPSERIAQVSGCSVSLLFPRALRGLPCSAVSSLPRATVPNLNLQRIPTLPVLQPAYLQSQVSLQLRLNRLPSQRLSLCLGIQVLVICYLLLQAVQAKAIGAMKLWRLSGCRGSCRTGARKPRCFCTTKCWLS
jgi:hypothetical protein